MSVDIVDRLRISWTSMTDMGNAERLQAANEIERLRTQLEMWQDGNIMAESHSEEIERLREQLRLASIDSFNTTAELDQVRAERDEARRILCQFESRLDFEYGNVDPSRFGPVALAASRGWDCFKEKL
jgi:hypothetical protein